MPLTTKTRFAQPLMVRWVLVLFALAVCAATVSPLIKPINLELLCSTNGKSKLLALTPDGQEARDSHALDCSFCLPQLGSALPDAHLLKLTRPVALQRPEKVRAALVIALTQPALPPRGPPVV